MPYYLNINQRIVQEIISTLQPAPLTQLLKILYCGLLWWSSAEESVLHYRFSPGKIPHRGATEPSNLEPMLHKESSTGPLTLEKAPEQQQRPATAKK